MAKTDVQPPAVMTTPAELRKAIRWVRPGRCPLPVLRAVQVQVTGNRLILTCFDYETVSTVDLDLACAHPGQGTVLADGDQLAGLVGALPSKGSPPVEVAVHDGQVDLTVSPGTVNAARLTVAGIDPAAYPALPALPPAVGLVPGDAFRAALRRVMAAASTDDTLPSCCAVRLHAEPGRLGLTATDRYRIGLDEVPWTTQVREGSWNLPRVQADRFAKVSTGPDVILFGDTQLAGLTDGTWTLITRPTASEPIDVRRYVKSRAGFDAEITADPQALAAGLRQAAKACDKDHEHVRIDADKVLRLAVGGYTGVVAGQASRPLWMMVNPVYLASLLDGLSGEVTIRCVAGKDGRAVKPVTITGGSAPDFTGMLALVGEK